MNVLVVEDNRSIRSVIKAYVEDLGYQITEAENGQEALEFFENNEIDIVLSDIEMPVMDGYAFARELRKRLGNEWLPIIFLSAHKADEQFVEGINAGGDAYLFKPVNGPVLQSMVSAMARIAGIQDQLQEANKRLEQMAYLDHLTGLNNRRGMLMNLGKEWARSSRNKQPLSVIILDVDHFKAYNDNYGHLAGDRCLAKIAKVLDSSVLRPCDSASRYGGEEFLVLLPETDLDGAAIVAERIRVAIEEAALPHEKSTTAKIVSASFGVACKGDEATPEELIKIADNRLYRAKENGRNCVSVQE